MLVETEMSQKHRSGENHSCRIGLVLALDIKTNVTAPRLKDGYIAAHVAARNDTRSSNKRSSDIG
jgi:hypothetical protein